MQAGALEIVMFSNIARISKDMADAKRVVSSTMGDIERSVGQAKSVLASLGIGLGVGYFVSLIKGSIDAADRLKDLSKSTGITVEDLAGLRLLAKQTGTDLDGLAKGINRMSVEMGKDPEKFRALGVTAKDNKEAFKQLADIFNLLPDIQQRNALAQAIFSKSWAELAPILSEGSKRIGEIIERGAKLSGITKEITDEADALNDKWAELTSTGGLMMRMVGPMLPLLNKLADDMLEVQKQTDGMNKGFSPLLETLRVLLIIGSDVSFVFQTIGKDMARAVENVKLIAKGDFAGSKALGEMFKKDAEESRKALDAWQKSIMAIGLTGAQPAATPAVDAAAAAAAAARAKAFLDKDAKRDAKLAAAELKLYEHAVKSLIDKLADLEHQSEKERLAFELWGDWVITADGDIEHLTGNLEKLTPAHKAMLESIAAEIDKRRELILVSKLNGEAYDALYKSQQALSALQTQAFQSDRDYLDDQQFQIGLIGKTRMEQEKLNEVRKIDLKLRQDLKAAADAAGDNMGQYDQARDALMQQAEEQKKVVLEGVAVRVAAERDWMTGAKSAFDEYLDHATNAAEQSRNLFTRTFQNMEDALVEFARTGKLDFKKLADSIIADIIRIQVRAAMTNAIQSAGGSGGFGSIIGAIGKIFGFGGGSGSPGGVISETGATGYFGPAARGYAFDKGVIPFARGGIVDSPTRFRFADGGAMRNGLMGEAGPEAILPLKRINGQLGVASEGGGGTVEINNVYHIDSRTDRGEIVAMMEQSRKRTLNDVADLTRRGGGFRKAIRG